jgi:hypothetical protein
MSSLTLGPENILFHSEYPIELCQEDQVMKHNTSSVMKHNPNLQGTMFSLPMVLISLFLHDQCILHRFLCSPSIRKSWNEISFKGRGF